MFPMTPPHFLCRSSWPERRLRARRPPACDDHPLFQLMSAATNDSNLPLALTEPRMVRPIRWEKNEETKEVRAEIDFPHRIRQSDIVSVDLDEASRMLSLKVKRFSGPEHCRRTSRWEFSQTLDDAVDLTGLQASIDFNKGKLILNGPLLLPDSTDSPKCLERHEDGRDDSLSGETKPEAENHENGYNSEEEQPPDSDVEVLSEHEAEPEDESSPGEGHSSQEGGSCPDNAIEIEDVGPDEDSDRISVSSCEPTDSIP